MTIILSQCVYASLYVIYFDYFIVLLINSTYFHILKKVIRIFFKKLHSIGLAKINAILKKVGTKNHLLSYFSFSKKSSANCKLGSTHKCSVAQSVG